jgi:hypothetical protein
MRCKALELTLTRTYALKDNHDEAMRRLEAFWAGSSLGRPALYLTVQNENFAPIPWDGPADPKVRDWMPQWHARCAEMALTSRRYLAEAWPVAHHTFGSCLVLLPLLAGGDYHYDTGNAWIEEIGEDLFGRPMPRWNPQHPVVRMMDETMRLLADRTGGRGYVNPPVLGTEPLTALSQLCGGERLCMELIERPALVHARRDALAEIYVQVAGHYRALLREQGQGEMSSSWLHTVAPGMLEAVQCDFAVMLSGDMFREFVMPDLERATQAIEYPLYHLDGSSQLRFLDDLASLKKLRGIQWNPEPGAQGVLKWVDAFKQIRRRGLLLTFNSWEIKDADEAAALVREIGPDGVSIALPTFETEAAAEAAIRLIERASADYRSQC